MGRRLLHVAEWHPGIERGGDEGVAKRVGADKLVDTCAARNVSDDPATTVAVESVAVGAEEDRALTALADCKVDGTGRAWGKRDGDNLATFAHDGEGSMSSFEAESLDVRANRLGDPQSIQREQRDQGVLDGSSESGRHKKGTEFVAVERSDV
jgi:hypothetical protein